MSKIRHVHQIDCSTKEVEAIEQEVIYDHSKKQREALVELTHYFESTNVASDQIEQVKKAINMATSESQIDAIFVRATEVLKK